MIPLPDFEAAPRVFLRGPLMCSMILSDAIAVFAAFFAYCLIMTSLIVLYGALLRRHDEKRWRRARELADSIDEEVDA